MTTESETLAKVENALSELIDPEAGINVVDLGLVYQIAEYGGKLSVDMIPTTAGCPLLHALAAAAHELLTPVFPEHEIEIRWRLDVDWTPDRIRKTI